MLLNGIPAGSPTCVNIARAIGFLFIGLFKLHRGVRGSFASIFKQHKEHTLVENVNLADTGKLVISQIAQPVQKRAASLAFKHPRAGLQETLYNTEQGASQNAMNKPSGRQNEWKDGEVN